MTDHIRLQLQHAQDHLWLECPCGQRRKIAYFTFEGKWTAIHDPNLHEFLNDHLPRCKDYHEAPDPLLAAAAMGIRLAADVAKDAVEFADHADIIEEIDSLRGCADEVEAGRMTLIEFQSTAKPKKGNGA